MLRTNSCAVYPNTIIRYPRQLKNNIIIGEVDRLNRRDRRYYSQNMLIRKKPVLVSAKLTALIASRK
jgi:hypothetical protein